MDKIRKIGTIIICGLCLAGMITVFLTFGFYALSYKGWQGNAVSDLFLVNASADFALLYTDEMEAKYSGPQTLLEKYESFVENAETLIEDFCTSSFPGTAVAKNLSDSWSGLLALGAEKPDGADGTDAAQAAADAEIEEFREYLASQGIGLTYVLLPAKEDYAAEDLDAADHWLPSLALDEAEEIAEELNETAGFEFSLSIFDDSRYNNVLDSYPDIADQIKAGYGYDYCLLVPDETGDYEVTINESETVSGSFDKTLLSDPADWDERTPGGAIAYHNMYRINNGILADIKNNAAETNADKTILVLGDSFSWPVTAYLSQGVGRIVTLHPSYFTGNVRVYIESLKPDQVIILYQEGQITGDFEGCYEALNE